ncbi:MAG: dTDP-4-dehydrorhamnose 3,5-epimerase [Clostridiales bacterium]|nr:dTDP-4-dehydrorhamnose 3,5-epimerase [Clostridiales bacterium]
MAEIRIIKTSIEGLIIIEPTVFGDARGYLMETYNKQAFARAGLTMTFVQDNESRSKKGVLRGLHMQTRFPQGKLVRVVAGAVYDVGVDLRRGSPTYGRCEGVILSAENKRMFYVPEGFAHGFLVLSDEAVFSYKCTNYYHPEYEAGIIYSDPDISVDWPLDGMEPILSEKDKRLPTLQEAGYCFDCEEYS